MTPRAFQSEARFWLRLSERGKPESTGSRCSYVCSRFTSTKRKRVNSSTRDCLGTRRKQLPVLIISPDIDIYVGVPVLSSLGVLPPARRVAAGWRQNSVVFQPSKPRAEARG